MNMREHKQMPMDKSKLHTQDSKVTDQDKQDRRVIQYTQEEVY